MELRSETAQRLLVRIVLINTCTDSRGVHHPQEFGRRRKIKLPSNPAKPLEPLRWTPQPILCQQLHVSGVKHRADWVCVPVVALNVHTLILLYLLSLIIKTYLSHELRPRTSSGRLLGARCLLALARPIPQGMDRPQPEAYLRAWRIPVRCPMNRRHRSLRVRPRLRRW